MRSEFEPIQDKKIIRRYLQYAVDSSETISLFVPDENIRFTGIVKSCEADTLRIELEVDVQIFADFEKMKRTLEEKKVRQIRLTFSLNEVYFFANTNLAGAKGTYLLLEILSPIFKLQRRNAMRVKVTEGFRCLLEIGKKKLTPHDLSATGTSLLLSASDAAGFQKKDLLPGAQLTFQNISVAVDLEVSNLEKQKKTELIKVGFRFLNLPNSMEQEIAKEAYLYTRKIWARWL